VALDQVSVTASSQFGDAQAPIHLIDGAGMQGDRHDDDDDANTMWHTVDNPGLSSPAPGLPASRGWVKFDFTAPQKLDSILVWNHNQKNLTDRGFRRTRIYGTSDGKEWFSMTATDAVEIPRAIGEEGLEPFGIDIAAKSRAVRSVILMADQDQGNYGSDIYGLSAVRFVRAAH
jgi:hypothetical protein